MTSEFVKLSDFLLKKDNALIVGDPCYIELFVDWRLDDTADYSEVMSELAIWEWDNRVATSSIYAIKDEGGYRALVLTINNEPPKELLEDVLKGDFYLCDFIGVDSGQVGFFSDDYLIANSDAANKPYLPLANDGYYAHTYEGDGVFPVAVWAKDGMPHTFAILTDAAYYDETWRKSFE